LASPSAPATITALPTAYAERSKATPGSDRTADTHNRVRTDHMDESGCVTLRLGCPLRHITIGRTHAGAHVLLLVHVLYVRIFTAAIDELLHPLIIDPGTRD
jgi:hypothetical protein